MDIEEVRKRVNSHLATAPRGTAADIARTASLGAGTLSKFRAGKHIGRADLVASRLAEIIASRETADLVATGQARIAWLVHSRRGIRLVKNIETLQAIATADSDARVLKIFYGRTPGIVRIVE